MLVGMGGDSIAFSETSSTPNTTEEASADARWTTDLGDSPIVGGKYKLTRMLGKGGMGAVYEGQNVETLKRCAVKLILNDHARNTEVRARFFREARASSVVDSAHIVQVFDSGVDEKHDVPFMVMELLDGESVEGVIDRLRVVDPQAAARIALQAAAGLAKAHQAGIVHRDIKPANLFLDRSDLGDIVVKVLDFGIAKVKMEQETEATSKLTRTGSALGTPHYMSPEQATGEKSIDGASDVWSLGVVLFEMLTGRTPFDADSLGSLMVQIITGDIPHVQGLAPWVPSPLAEIVHRCLSRAREHRYLDAGQLRDALQAWTTDSRLYPAMIIAPSDDLRSHVTQPIAISDSMLKLKPNATATATALAVAGLPAAPVQRRRLVVPLLAAAAIAAGVLGFVAMRAGTDPDGPEPSPAPAGAPVVAAPVEQPKPVVDPSPTAPPPAPLELRLPVAPPGVEVDIDGTAATVEDNHIRVVGFPGDVRKVTLRKGKASHTSEVFVTNDGTLVPSRLELPAAGTTPVSAEVKKVKKPEKPASGDTRKPPKPPGPGISTSTDEFDTAPPKQAK